MSRAYDDFDQDAIAQLRDSRAWDLLQFKIRGEIEGVRDQLERIGPATSPGEIHKLAGQAEAFRTVLRLPEILEEEIGAQLKEENHGE